MSEEREDILIKKCIEWDRQAQNALYKKYCAKMFAVCFQYSKNREEAEDTFHEGFMKVFENLKNFSNAGSLEGYIRRIMVNLAIEKYRKSSRLFLIVNIDDNKEFLNHYSTDDILSQIEADDLMQLIQNLPPAYKIVFNLYVLEGLKHKEIAEQLGITEGTSKSNLYEAKAILQKKINQNNGVLELTGRQHGR
ncbi:MAG: sigma-70 family RNA polymerase sigma factor [Bacteroidota bacterium]